MGSLYKCLIFSVGLLLFSSCKSGKEQKENTPLQNSERIVIDSTRFNVIILPAQNLDCYFIDNRGLDTIFYDAPYIIDTAERRNLKSIKGDSYIYRKLWACNLPSYFKHNDTILVTGKIYISHGDEKLSGRPTMLTKILANVYNID